MLYKTQDLDEFEKKIEAISGVNQAYEVVRRRRLVAGSEAEADAEEGDEERNGVRRRDD
jgi:hypothetical protein